MKKQNAASLPREKRHITKKTCNSILQHPPKNNQYQNSGISNKGKRYPHSDRNINLSKPCPYCDYATGLTIIRWHDDLGFVKCGRCDAALFSLNESKPEQGLTHIGKSLDSFLPNQSDFNGEVAK